MRGRQARPCSLYWSCFARPFARFSSSNARINFACGHDHVITPGATNAATSPSHSPSLVPVNRKPSGWNQLFWVSPTSVARRLNCRLCLPSLLSNTSHADSGRASLRLYGTFSRTNTLQARGFAHDAAKTKAGHCWSCDHDTSPGNGLFCPSCNAIQAVDPDMDFFKIFGLKPSFEVDTKSLEKSYKDLQKRLHPDLAASKSQREQGYSAEQSAHVIQAYYVLLRPLSRARYLLGLHGIHVEEEGTIDDPALLMEIMEIRESIDEVSDSSALQKARSENDKRRWKCEEELTRSFSTNDLKRAVSYVQRLAYFAKVDEEILRKL